jgi:transposase
MTTRGAASARHWLDVRKLAEEGASQRAIARKLALNRRTVAKMLAIDGPPHPSPKPRGSQLDPLMGAIMSALARRPEISATALTEQLRATHGYSGSVDLVRRRVAQLRSADPSLAPPAGPRAGQMAEWDWLKLDERVPVGAGATRNVWALIAWLPFSGTQAAHFTLDATLESFLEGHVRILARLGGVPEECRYDHLPHPVAKRDARGALRWHKRFRELRRHYGFASSAVSAPATTESVRAGPVEHLRDDFWPAVRFTTLGALDEAYARWREGQIQLRRETANGSATAAARLAEERRAMRALPHDEFAFALQRTVRVPLDGYVRHGACFYRAPPAFIGERVELHASRDEVWLAWNDKRLVTYPRSYRTGQWMPEPPA